MRKIPVFDIGDTLIPSHENTNRKIREKLGEENDTVPEFPINEYNVFKTSQVEDWMRKHSLDGDAEEVSSHYIEWAKSFLRENAVPELEEISESFGPIGFISDNTLDAKNVYREVFDPSGINYEGFVVSEEAGAEKPDEKIFKVFIDKRAEPAESFVYFGNYVERDSAAEKVGMGFVWVTQYHLFGSREWTPRIEQVTVEEVESALKEVGG